MRSRMEGGLARRLSQALCCRWNPSPRVDPEGPWLCPGRGRRGDIRERAARAAWAQQKESEAAGRRTRLPFLPF